MTAIDTLALLVQRYGVDLSRRSPIEIPGTSRKDLPGLFAACGFTTGAEIGVWTGAFAAALCRANSALHLLCVDPWQPYTDYRDTKEKRKWPGIYEQAQATLAPYHCDLIRQFSMEAVKDVPLDSLDFVYIDGNHSFEFVVQDLAFWSRRVRSGGIISGHDYQHYPSKRWCFHVVEAVNAYTDAYQIAPWFVLGTKAETARQEEEHRFRSYLWVKA